MSYRLFALLVVAAGVAFRLLFISDSDLWLDEIWTANAAAAQNSFGDVLNSALADQHPPLYDLLLHGWLRLTPDVPVAGRYLSLLFGALGLWMTYVYATRISGRKAAGLFAVSLLALNCFHATHSIEMRYYALVYLLALGTVSHSILAMRKEGNSGKEWTAFAMYALPLLYTHVYGAFLLAALGCAAILLAVFRRIPATRLMHFFIVAAGLVCLYLPFMLVILRAPKHGGAEWMTLASPVVFFEYLYNYSNKNPVESAVVGLPLLLSFWMYKKAPVATIALVLSVVLTFLAGYLFSVQRQPMLHERYTMVYFPSLVLLASVIWADVFRNRRWGLLLLACAVAASAVINLSVVNPFRERLRHEPWRAMAEALHALPPTDRAPVYAEEPGYINYYLRRAGEAGAQPVAARAADDARFWYVQTEYNHPSIPGIDTLLELERKEFSGRFALVLFGRKN